MNTLKDLFCFVILIIIVTTLVLLGMMFAVIVTSVFLDMFTGIDMLHWLRTDIHPFFR
jgi:hypothetical protein